MRYFVDEDKGVVVCSLRGDNTMIAHANRVFKNIQLTSNLSFSDKTEFIGKARCNFDAGDEFDVEFGKKLAFERASKKQEKYRKQMIEKIRTSVLEDLEKL